MSSHSPDADEAQLPVHGQNPQDYLNERVEIECEEEDEVYGKCSADVTFARDRLAVLLQQIKKGDVVVPVVKEQKKKIDDDGDPERRGPGRPRKLTKNDPRQVIFELRGKGFTLRDSDGIESVYSLCRIWYNTRKEDEKVTRDRIARDREAREEEERVAAYDDSLDLLATKEIHALPRPRSPVDIQLWPERSDRLDSHIVLTGRGVNEAAVKKAYAAHWKNVKRNWVSHQREVDQRFYRSINLLETVHGIAQQNAL